MSIEIAIVAGQIGVVAVFAYLASRKIDDTDISRWIQLFWYFVTLLFTINLNWTMWLLVEGSSLGAATQAALETQLLRVGVWGTFIVMGFIFMLILTLWVFGYVRRVKEQTESNGFDT